MFKSENNKYKFLLEFANEFEKKYGKENLTIICSTINSIDDFFKSDVHPEFQFIKKNIFYYSDYFTFKESIWVRLKMTTELSYEVVIGATKSIKGNCNDYKVNIEEKSINKINTIDNTDVSKVFICLERAMEEVNSLVEKSVNQKVVSNYIDSFDGAEKYSYI